MAANIAKINYLNIVLILVSCVAAYIIPFKLFLFAYAILGPLHYLTEISWLHERQYFTTAKYDFLYLFILTIILTVAALYLRESWGNSTIYIAFLSAPLLVLIKNLKLKIFGCLAVIASTFLFFNTPGDFTSMAVLIIAILLPTIIHVYIFTGAFMVFGAMKEKGYTGFIAFGVFVFCSLIYFFYTPNFDYQIDSITKATYSGNPFWSLNYAMFKVFNLGEINSGLQMDYQFYSAPIGVTIMRFIAFAYTYHYLNWFSKTTIIGWHKQSKVRLGIIITIWIVSIVLYKLDYSLGFKWLFMLSMLHVFLEFPLNYKTFISIGQGIGKSIASKKA